MSAHAVGLGQRKRRECVAVHARAVGGDVAVGLYLIEDPAQAVLYHATPAAAAWQMTAGQIGHAGQRRDADSRPGTAPKRRLAAESGHGYRRRDAGYAADPGLRGRPSNFDIPIRDVKLAAGAGFIVVLTGNIMTMPGLPRNPAANGISLDHEGEIQGLF